MFTNLQKRAGRLFAVSALLLISVPAYSQRFYPEPRQDPAVAQVESWYQQYLHRSADLSGLQSWTTLLRQGASPQEVQANILGSEEYYQKHNNDPAQFIVGLYNDVLGVSPSHTQVGVWLDRYDRDRGDRIRLARHFLSESRERSGEHWGERHGRNHDRF